MVQSGLQNMNELAPNLELLHARLLSFESSTSSTGTRPLARMGSIEFLNVSYAYRPGDDAIRNISIRIHRGETLGIVGPSGGGKSTFVQLLLGLRPPASGTITIEGVPHDDVIPADWASLVALVPQEPSLMEASVADNIRFLRDGISRTRVEEAARAAHVFHDLKALPDSFDTLLGPRGRGLSGGQKQRVVIARALAGSPELLVLDEPTSALDIHSERLLQETIAELKGSITIVIVTHRLATLKYCDRLLVISDGAIEMVGTPSELVRQPGFYQSVQSTDVDEPTARHTLDP